MKSRLISLALLAAAALASPAQAQYSGDRPIRMIVPSGAGTGQDAALRILGDVLGKNIKQTFAIENRPGASGMIGTDVVAKAAPDGYTLGAGGSSALAAIKSLYNSVPYDPAKDFAPVYLLAGAPSVLFVRADGPDKTLADLIARIKAAPKDKKLSFAQADATAIVAGQMLQNALGVEMLNVPYKAGSDAMTDTMRGDVDMHFSSVPAGRALLSQGRIRALAVAAPQRIASLPDTPTYAEAGLKGIELLNWVGIVAPAGTPAGIVKQLADGIRVSIKDPELMKRYEAFGLDLYDSSPEHFAAFIKSESAKWSKNLADAGVKPE